MSFEALVADVVASLPDEAKTSLDRRGIAVVVEEAPDPPRPGFWGGYWKPHRMIVVYERPITTDGARPPGIPEPEVRARILTTVWAGIREATIGRLRVG